VPGNSLRHEGIDALRGVAVILMVSQHLIAWLWNAPPLPAYALAQDHPILMGLNALGYLSAPLFIVLAGAGATMFLGRHGDKGADTVLVRRGAYVLGLGYALNFAVPGWFTPGSWYVLHLIGLCLLMAPAVARLETLSLAGLAVGVLVAAVVAQTLLGTPSYLNNAYMTDASSLAAIIKLTVVEGHFPILPWSALFLVGMVAARLTQSGKRKSLLLAATAITAIGVCLSLAPFAFPLLRDYPLLARITALSTYTFPLYPPAACLLSGLGVGAIFVVTARSKQSTSFPGLALANLGRASLTVFLLHIFLFREVLGWIGGTHKLQAGQVGLVLAGVLVALGSLAWLWRDKNYCYGAEWLMRRVASK
jgi:uncharacterized membrane protein